MSSLATRLLPSRGTALGIALALVALGVMGWLSVRPTPAIAHTVQKRVVVAEVMGTGTLEARVSANIGSKIAGRIETLSVDQGDRVKAGQVLVRLDDADLRRQVEVALADQAAAEAAVERVIADKIKSEAVLRAARREHERIRELVSKTIVSQVEADKAQDAVRIAEADLRAAQSSIKEAKQRQAATSRALEFQEALLTETVIRAAFTGLITIRHREPGDVVVPGSPLFSLIATDELWVSAWVDETEMSRLAVDQSARVVFRSQTARAFTGKVARLGREVDRETREFIVDVGVTELPKNWAIGQRAEVFAEVTRSEDALAIPTDVIRRREDGSAGVFVLVEGRARWRKVEVGIQGQGWAEVVGGLQEGDHVLKPSGPRALREGGRVVLP